MKIRRNRAGTKIVWARPAGAPTVASATVSSVVANGANDMPPVIRVFTNTGRTTSTRTPLDELASARPWASASSPAFAAP